MINWLQSYMPWVGRLLVLILFFCNHFFYRKAKINFRLNWFEFGLRLMSSLFLCFIPNSELHYTCQLLVWNYVKIYLIYWKSFASWNYIEKWNELSGNIFSPILITQQEIYSVCCFQFMWKFKTFFNTNGKVIKLTNSMRMGHICFNIEELIQFVSNSFNLIIF